jgi:mRNA interferase RelE/StbE
MYRVHLTKRAERGLERVHEADHRAYKRLKAAVVSLSSSPRPPGAIKLKGLSPPAWRLRVGEYRIVYEIDDDELVVIALNVAPRGEVYR